MIIFHLVARLSNVYHDSKISVMFSDMFFDSVVHTQRALEYVAYFGID